MGDGILKVLYASEEEQIDLDNDGSIMITSPSGETVVHTVVMPEEAIEPKAAVNGNQPDMQMEGVEEPVE